MQVDGLPAVVFAFKMAKWDIDPRVISKGVRW